MKNSVSANAYFLWPDVCDFANVAAPETLPGETVCPWCSRDSFRVHHDTVLGGHWYYCSKCGFSGDSIDVLEKTAGQPIAEIVEAYAARYEQRNCLEIPEKAYAVRATAVSRMRDFASLWFAASTENKVQDRDSLRQLLRAVNCHLFLYDRNPSDSLRQLIGSCSLRDVVRLVTGLPVGPKAKTTAAERLFSATLAKEEAVLVLPGSDLPGRISRLMFIAMSDKLTPVCGSIGVAADDPSIFFDIARDTASTMLVVDNLLLALGLHAAHLRDNQSFLPVVYCRPSVEAAAAIQTERGRDIVLATTTRDANSLAMAAACNCKIHAMPVGLAAERLASRTPRDIVSRAINSAVDWKILLEEELLQRSGGAADVLLAKVGLKGAAAIDFIKSSGMLCDHFASWLSHKEATVATNSIAHTAVTVDGVTALIRYNSWELLLPNGRRKPLQNYGLTIDRVLCRADNGNVLYEYRVHVGKECRTGLASAASFHRKVRNSADRMMTEAGLTALHPNRSEVKRAYIALAKKLTAPPTYTAATHLGWQKTTRCFAFPDFTIDRFGDVTASVMLKRKRAAFSGIRDTTLSASQNAVLAACSDEVTAVWKLAHYVLVSAISFAKNVRQPALAVCGDEDWLERVLGKITAIERSRLCNRNTGWPTLHSSTLLATRCMKLTDVRGLAFACSDDQLTALAVFPGCLTIDLAAAEDAADESGALLAVVVLDYLRYAMARNLAIPRFAENPTAAIHDDMRRWFAVRGGNPDAPRGIRRFPYDVLLALFLDRFYWEGDAPGPIVLRANELRRICAVRGCPSPNLARVAKRLSSMGIVAKYAGFPDNTLTMPRTPTVTRLFRTSTDQPNLATNP